MGRWMAAVLRCGPDAALSHRDAAAHWKIAPVPRADIDVSVPRPGCRRAAGIKVHRRAAGFGQEDVTERNGIPVTRPICTLVDLATCLRPGPLEAAINEADKLDLVNPERLRTALDDITRRPGIGVLRKVLDRRTFVLSDSGLERRFLPIARAAGLPKPWTRQ